MRTVIWKLILVYAANMEINMVFLQGRAEKHQDIGDEMLFGGR